MIAAGEVVLPRRTALQPTPDLHLGGDCGACVLGGALGLTVPEVYARFDSDGITNHGEMERLLRCAVSSGLADRCLDEPASWTGWHGTNSFGSPGYLHSLPWFQYVRMAIDAGYYGLATVDFSKRAGADLDGHGLGTNHWVLLCGARSEGSVSGKYLTGEVLVSCSARSSGRKDEWVEAREFLRHRGGYDVLFVRPRGAHP